MTTHDPDAQAALMVALRRCAPGVAVTPETVRNILAMLPHQVEVEQAGYGMIRETYQDGVVVDYEKTYKGRIREVA